MSVFIFITGFVCGHYLSQRWRESADKNKQPKSLNNPKTMESDLELKENVRSLHHLASNYVTITSHGKQRHSDCDFFNAWK